MTMFDRMQPYEVRVPAGESVWICQCGYTAHPPFCDGSHQDHPPAQPVELKAEGGRDKSYWICGCGRSAKRPLCDGTHNTLD